MGQRSLRRLGPVRRTRPMHSPGARARLSSSLTSQSNVHEAALADQIECERVATVLNDQRREGAQSMSNDQGESRRSQNRQVGSIASNER